MRARVVGLVLSVVAVVVIGTIGALHTARGKALWRRATPTGRCPFGYGSSPEDRAKLRRAFADAHRGARPAPSRPAGPWTLDETTRADVDAWAGDHHARCTPRDGDLECSDVPGFDALWFAFDERDRLVTFTELRSARDPSPIELAFAQLDLSGHTRLGAPTSFHDADLKKGALQQLSIEWCFSDYYASARATNDGRGRFLLVDEYRSLR